MPSIFTNIVTTLLSLLQSYLSITLDSWSLLYNNASWSVFMCSLYGTRSELQYHTHRTHIYSHNARFLYVHSFCTFDVLRYSQIWQKCRVVFKIMFNLTKIITPIIPVTNIISIWLCFITIIVITPTSIFIFLIIVTAIIPTIRSNFLLTAFFIRMFLKGLVLTATSPCVELNCAGWHEINVYQMKTPKYGYREVNTTILSLGLNLLYHLLTNQYEFPYQMFMRKFSFYFLVFFNQEKFIARKIAPLLILLLLCSW